MIIFTIPQVAHFLFEYLDRADWHGLDSLTYTNKRLNELARQFFNAKMAPSIAAARALGTSSTTDYGHWNLTLIEYNRLVTLISCYSEYRVCAKIAHKVALINPSSDKTPRAELALLKDKENEEDRAVTNCYLYFPDGKNFKQLGGHVDLTILQHAGEGNLIKISAYIPSQKRSGDYIVTIENAKWKKLTEDMLGIC